MCLLDRSKCLTRAVSSLTQRDKFNIHLDQKKYVKLVAAYTRHWHNIMIYRGLKNVSSFIVDSVVMCITLH